jgi:hypothetical protein
MFTKVIGLFKKYPATFPVFLEKNERQKHIPPCLIMLGSFPDFSKKSRQGYRTFSKKFNKVIGLF